MNRLRLRLNQHLEILQLVKYWKPSTDGPLQTVADVEAALNRDKNLLLEFDVATEFGKEIKEFNDALARSLEEGLVMLNGKWLFDHFLVKYLGKNPDYWRREWIKHAEMVGGLLAVRDLWQRITGSPP
jgi:hypothetical protein